MNVLYLPYPLSKDLKLDDFSSFTNLQCLLKILVGILLFEQKTCQHFLKFGNIWNI